MLIDINKIVVGDRIRKDFGDIQELAEDIKENGLINPPVVNKSYELLAGERRLRACKSLGWPQIEVRMMDTRDAEHELNIEISENDVRKGFTKSERVDYIRRLLRIEQAKAKENMSAGGEGREISRTLRSDEATAEQFGISSNTMRRELFIADNADLLDPTDFAEWDEGRLSTNKAYQRIRAAKEQAERERDDAREKVEALGEDIGDLQREVAALEKQADKAYEDGYRAAESAAQRHAAQPQVVTREVESEATRNLIKRYESESKRHAEEYESLRHRYESVKSELDHVRKAQEDGVNTPHGDAFADALGELVATRHRYSHVVELADVFAEIDMLASQSLEGGSGK